MELINVERVAPKGGSIRCIVQLTDGPRKRSEGVDQLIKLETGLGIQKPETFEAFGANLNEIKSQLMNLLKDFKAEGKEVAGYGASVGVTTILHHFGLNSDMLSYLVDDNATRQNLYSPGLHIPVLSPKALTDKKPAYVVILAWQYAKPIMEKNRAYLQQGGHFITILPKVEVI